jgi:hypothetical protein
LVDDAVELASLGVGKIEHLVDDTGVAGPAFRSLAQDAEKRPDTLDLLSRRMQQINFDAEELEPQLMQELQNICLSCGNKHKCKRDLTKRSANLAWLGYCPAAPTLVALMSELALLSTIADWRAGPDA